MGSESWRRDAFGGSTLILVVIAAAFLSGVLPPAMSWAGDLSDQPTNNLSIANSVTNVLLQAGAPAPTAGGAAGITTAPSAAAPAPGAATPPPGGEESWLSGLHISGYGSQTAGVWENPSTLQAYTPSRNNIAVLRSLLQIDGNYRLNENNTFFARGWFAYEPPYAFNYANNVQYTNQFKPKPVGMSYGQRTNESYNTYELRDAWWENKTGPLTLFVGNQIVVWGQSLAFRVDDVINPANTCWAFGLANLEQSRVAQWMVHPILNLPEWGPFTSNFLELVVQPGFQPNWQPQQYQDPLRKYKSALTAGRANPCLPSVDHGPSARFDVQYPTTPVFGADFVAAGTVGPYTAGGAYTQIKTPTGKPLYSADLGSPALLIEFGLCTPGAVKPGFNPYTAYLRRFPQGFKCNLGLNKHNNPWINSIGDQSVVDVGHFQVPGMQPQNWNEGVRYHTLYGATEWTALYYYDSVNQGNPATIKWQPFTNLWYYQYPAINEFGLTVDRPLPAPASIAEYFPAVFRGEYLYQNHTTVDTTQFQNLSGQRWSDISKFMVAIDVDQAYAPWLTSTGNLTANFEYVQTTTMDDCKMCWIGNALDGRLLKNSIQMLGSIGTSWWWSDFAPTMTGIYDPKGTTFFLIPSITLNPPWTKKYFVKLQAIQILGSDKQQSSGLFKGQNYIYAQFQYNFNLI